MSVPCYNLALDAPTAGVLRSLPPRAILSSSSSRFCSLMRLWSTMLARARLRAIVLTSATVLLLVCASLAGAQTEDALGDGAADPVKLFEQAQTAHARGDLERALSYYEEAIKVKPEFPEAEFQMGNVLASLGRLGDAEVGISTGPSNNGKTGLFLTLHWEFYWPVPTVTLKQNNTATGAQAR